MKNLGIEIDETQMMVALDKLTRDLCLQQDSKNHNFETLWDIVEEMDAVTFSMLHKNVYFADFLRQVFIKSSENKIELPENEFLESDSQLAIIASSNKIEIPASTSEEDFVVPDLETPLYGLQLPTRFMKLINRLRKANINNFEFKLGNTFRDLIDLKVVEVASLIGVGAFYVETLKELKSLVAEQTGYSSELEKAKNKSFDCSIVDTSNFLISMSGVELRFVKPLDKYARQYQLPDMSQQIELILKFERDKLLELPGFGKGVVDLLMEFKSIIEAEIKAIYQGEVDYLALQSQIIVPFDIETMPLTEIERVILEDIDTFLDKLADDEVDIAQRRWGFVEDKETLEQVGARLGLTRERVRQKEALINKLLILNLKVNPNVLWHLLEPHMAPSLKEQLPDLFGCFSSEKSFYEFLDIVCQQEKLFYYVYPEIDKTILNSYFAENGAPIHIQSAMDVIEEAELVNVKNPRNAILYLQKQGVLVVDGEDIVPKMLGKSEASACILVSHPKGLPWLDIAALVNANGYSRTEIYEDRLDSEAFKHKDYIYLAGKGIYKHTRFISADITDITNLEKVFAELCKYTEVASRDVFHLNECYKSSNYLKRFNYYEIRYFIKHFGEDYGYYFSGRSQADSVGREKGFKNITQKDVIIEAMNTRIKPYTKPEVASLLKSKSLAHASIYLDGLVEEARVVQVDRQLYTTPAHAYRNIDLPKYLDSMQSILEKFSKPVDASIFQKMLNPLLQVSYSKYFYSSIARCFAAERGWFRSHGLYSIEPILFANLTDALNALCTIDTPVKETIARLQQHIAITKENASQIVHNWRKSSA
ncbi:sigma factor-like helix-turn-helix DNA-binding protein [Pseudoalteromonas sp. MT33b]|uniref:sigma factor-like helix-turn-helix DNA-binding protein n=1 Tax=Pseudoalteromonas sp. MT33b TaxID=2759705 RepID=UPI001C70F316|nr:sigma factor-like helix-turn-helix DNA-binding protein [Pseudoalteromonas sp. MT33b]